MGFEMDDKKKDRMMEEIRHRVLERYGELQNIESVKESTQANLQALHEITSLPMQEIQSIAAEVSAKYGTDPSQIAKAGKIKSKELEVYLPDPKDTATFETLTTRHIRLKRSFTPHFIAYSFTNGVLTALNYMTSPEFPWAMFPVSFWGIGLAIHYVTCVRWPTASLKRKIAESRREVANILDESWKFFQIKRYQKTSTRKPFVNAVYRLLTAEADKKAIVNYLQAVENSLRIPMSTDLELRQIAIQVVALKKKYLTYSPRLTS